MSTRAILTVLSNIPWGQVVENAAKVADGAARLWNSVTSFSKSAASPSQINDSPSTKPASEEELLRLRVQALEETVRNLREQIQASSEVIKALADQNTQFVNRIELNRLRLQRFIVAPVSSGSLLFAAVTYILLRQ
jgi:hypothetical protein